MDIIKPEWARRETYEALRHKIADGVIIKINEAIEQACSKGKDECIVDGLVCYGYESPGQVEYLAKFARSAGYFAKVNYTYGYFPTLSIWWTNKTAV